MHICSVISTRPEILKMSRVMAALDAVVQHTIIHTNQNYSHELNGIFFDEMGLRKPDYVLDTHGDTATSMTADIMLKLEPLLVNLRPAAVVILGDTNGCMATAYVCARLKIKLFHLEAGNRSFSDVTPEEINRKIVDHLPGVQLCYSERSLDNLLREGIHPSKIVKVGSPMAEVLNHYKPQIDASDILSRLSLTPKDYFVVSCHREENTTPEKFKQFIALLRRLAEFGQRIIVTCHPRTRKRLDQECTTDLYDVTGHHSTLPKEVELYRPFGFFEFVKLQQNARCVLSDSGTLFEESGLLHFPALSLRESHERPESDEVGGTMLTGFSIPKVLAGIEYLNAAAPMQCPAAYSVPNVSDIVVRTILSHTKF